MVAILPSGETDPTALQALFERRLAASLGSKHFSSSSSSRSSSSSSLTETQHLSHPFFTGRCCCQPCLLPSEQSVVRPEWPPLLEPLPSSAALPRAGTRLEQVGLLCLLCWNRHTACAQPHKHMDRRAWDLWQRVRERKPLVQCITNFVSMASLLLLTGQSCRVSCACRPVISAAVA